MGKMVVGSDKLSLEDVSGNKIAIKGYKQDLRPINIDAGGIITPDIKESNNIICEADINLNEITFENASAAVGQSGYIAIKNTGTRSHDISWSSGTNGISIKWIDGSEHIASNVSGEVTAFYYYITTAAILLSNKKIFV
tara:strand:+ start:155 stop:571 length:417 start_codon:yes stop_codon:yes gene_type:complete